MMSEIKRLFCSAAEKCGYRLVRIDKSDPTGQAAGMRPLFSVLRQAGFAPRHIVDVGANRGIWTREAIRFFPEARYTLVEPQSELKSYIQDLIDRGCNIEWISAGASDQPGISWFSIHSRDDSSSFLTDGSQIKSGEVQRIKTDVRTLNGIVASSGAGVPDMVKIDAEGFDLKVLEGASDLLGRTDVLLVEAYVFGPGAENTVSAVMQKMAKSGYRLVDITDTNRSPKYGVVWLCELAFLRNDSSLLDGFCQYE